jgi:hypothetical protein
MVNSALMSADGIALPVSGSSENPTAVPVRGTGISVIESSYV